MKTYVINLKRREDRKEHFDKINSSKLDYEYFRWVFDGHEIDHDYLLERSWDTDKNWIDPIENTRITKGEVGCFLTHYHLWQYAAQARESIIVLEDDAVITDNFSSQEVERLLTIGYDLVYLGWKEMSDKPPSYETPNLSPTGTPIHPVQAMTLIKKGDFEKTKQNLESAMGTRFNAFVRPQYPYWTLAYAITPEGADKLLAMDPQKSIIPVDEFLPNALQTGKINCIGYKENVIVPRGRSSCGSDVAISSRYDYFLDRKVHALTVATDVRKIEYLDKSSSEQHLKFKNLGQDVEWKGGDMASAGGGQKINLVKEYVNSLPDESLNDLIFFCDGYDVFLNDGIDEILSRYIEIGFDVLFAAEQHCWPDENLSEAQTELTNKLMPDVDSKYKFLNSGIYLGKVSVLKEILNSEISDNDDDQLYFQKAYLSEKYSFAIDSDCYIFQCSSGDDVVERKGNIFNEHTRCYNCVYHGNGGRTEKDKFVELYETFYGGKTPITYIPTRDYEVLDNDIIMVDFLSKSMCDRLIELSEARGGFKPDEGDKVPGQELRLRELDLWDELSRYWERFMAPIIDKHWDPCNFYGVRDAFLIKYELDGQRKLPLHSDASLVTGSVKLNDGYEGGELYFPRQKFSNKDVPVGKCILFPGQVSHPHTSKELQSGTKWSLTIWTNRMWNE